MVPGVLHLPPKKSDEKKFRKYEIQRCNLYSCFCVSWTALRLLLLYNKINNVLPIFNVSFLKKVTSWLACHMGGRPQVRECAESSAPSPPGDRRAAPPRPLLSGIFHLRTFHPIGERDCRVCISGPRHPWKRLCFPELSCQMHCPSQLGSSGV